MSSFHTFSRRAGADQNTSDDIPGWILRPGRRTNRPSSPHIGFASFLRLSCITLFAGAMLLCPPALHAKGVPVPVIKDPPPASAKDGTDNFMGMRIGAHVRVTCTAPAIELNNATLVAISKSDITVASATGERYFLPRPFTVLSDPVNWKRTSGMVNEPEPSPRSGAGWMWLPLLLLAAVALAGWLWIVRRGEPSEEELAPGEPGGSRKRRTSKLGTSSRNGRLVLSNLPKASNTRMSLTAIPQATPPPSPSAPTEADPEGIEELIETRCYGTAIERLEKQVKQKPDDFKPRLQLLKIYVIIDNRKQMDRVMHQIEFHPRLTTEQKQEARQCLPNKTGKPAEARDTKAAPQAQTIPAAAESKPPTADDADQAKPEEKPAEKSAEKPQTRHAVIAPKPDAKTLAEAAARFGLNPATVNVSATPPPPDAIPEAKIADTESKSDAGASSKPDSKPDSKPAAKPAAKSKSRSRSKAKTSSPDSDEAPAAAPAGSSSEE